MSPLWLIGIVPVATSLGVLIGALLSSGAYDRGYRQGRKSTSFAPYRVGEHQ